MSELTPLQAHVLAYYSSGQALDVNIATRWFPTSEVVNNMDDKIQQAVRKFGMAARKAARPAAEVLVAYMLENGGWASQANEFGGTMHSFRLEEFRKALDAFNAGNPIVAKAAAGGETFWADKFAELTN